MQPACTVCRIELQPHKTGITVIEINKNGPHRIWQADLSRCPDCGIVIITGYANQPIAEHFHPNFSDELKMARERVGRTYEVHCI